MSQGGGIRHSGCLARATHNKLTGKYTQQRYRTKANKIRKIKAAMQIASDKHKASLAKRLEFWQQA